MQSLIILFSALSVYGIGVTIVDMFGVFENTGPAEAGGETGDSGDGEALGGSDDGAAADSADSGDADSVSADDDTIGNDQTDDQPGAAAHSLLSFENRKQAELKTTRTGGVSRGTQIVARSIGMLRGTVYFSLGAGPTGLFGILTGQPVLATLGWSAAAGVMITLISKLLRKIVRRDLDSSIKPEEYLMDQAVISIPVLPGQIGKALVRRYNREVELYVKAKDPLVMLAKGSTVRITDMDEAVYFVEEE